MPYIQNAGALIIETIIGLVLYVVLLRFWMQWVRADFRNELGQFIIAVTNPVIVPLRRILPSIGMIDTATIVFAIGIAFAKIYAIYLIGHENLSYLKLFTRSIAELLNSCIDLFFIAIIISFIASWIAPHSYHPILNIARAIAEPMLAPARRLLPTLGGIDFSPMLVFLFLSVTRIIIVAPIYNLNV